MNRCEEIKITHITPTETELNCIRVNVLCDYKDCGKRFANTSVLGLHRSQCHEHITFPQKYKNKLEGEIRYHCPIKGCMYYDSYESSCKKNEGRYFRVKKYVKQHFLKVHALRSIPCPGCDKSFATDALLSAHSVSCGKSFICSCGQSLSAIEGYLTHIKRFQHENLLDLDSFKRRKNRVQTTTGESVSKANVKTEPSHMIAAIALSELSGAATVSKPLLVDTGMQTEAWHPKKCHRSKASQSHRRRKQTTEMETQTRLTNLKSRSKKICNSKSIGKSSVENKTIDATVCTSVPISISTNSSIVDSRNPSTSVVYSNYNDSASNSATNFELNSNCSTPNYNADFSLMTEIDCLPYLLNTQMSSSTQTSPREKLPMICSVEEVSVQFPPVSHLLTDGDPFPPSVDSPTPPLHHPSLGSIRSSSIETQTDVFLNEIGALDTQSLLSPSTFSMADATPSSLWCTSETQTCEDFSQIEPYLYSDSHTQTYNENVSSVLFPELNFGDSASYATIHTQTGVEEIEQTLTHSETQTMSLL